MIELSQIFLQILTIFVFCYFPQYYLNILNIKQQSIIERISIGAIINIFILLLLSFISQSNFNFIFIILIIIFCSNLFFLITENWKFKLLNKKLIFLLLFVLVFSFDLAINLKLGWDAQNFWIFKTLNFIQGHDIYNLKNLPRYDYPHLGSFIWAIYTKISFLEHEYLGRIFYIFFFCVSIFSVAELLNLDNAKKIIFSSILIIFTYNVLLFNGYQEILIFSIFTLFSKYFYLTTKKNISKNYLNFYWIIIFLLFLSSIWIKNDVIYFSFVLLISILCVPKKSYSFRLKIFFSFFLIIFLRFLIFKEIGLDNSLHSQYLNNFLIFDRIFLIIKYLFFGLLSNITYLISIFLIIFMLFNRKNNLDLIFYIVSMLFNFILICSFYLFTITPVEWTLKANMDRILFEVAGIYFIPIIIFINAFFKKILNNK